MSEQLVNCPKCHKPTTLALKNEKVNDEIEHNYYQCQHCQAVETVFYSDDKLRKLIKKQSKEKNSVIKRGNEKIIKRRMAELRKEYEE